MEKPCFRYVFTIFTPTFNRDETLYRVYESLKTQTYHDFEWIIVDDGSTDNTRDIVKSWQQHAIFPIRYIWQDHQGKHIAFNRGVNTAGGEFFLNVDSDDAFVPEALARFKHHWDSIPENEKCHFSAVTALCKDQHGRLVGNQFPKDVIDSDSLEMFYKNKLKGDKWGFHKTLVLREFPFPTVKGINFIPESIVWNGIARKYRTRFINEQLLICFKQEVGRTDHLSRPGRPSNHALAYLLCNLAILNEEINYFRYRPEHFFLTALRYIRFSLHCGVGITRQSKRLNNLKAKLLWMVVLPNGVLMYLADKILKR